HLRHGLHDPVRLLRILASQQLAQHGGNDLPRQPELVLEPAALVFRSTGGQLLPQLVHFLLRLAVYEQGYRRRELELRAAVQGVKVLTLELEGAAHDRPLRPRPRLAVARHPHDFGALEDRDVEVHRLFGVAVEPDAATPQPGRHLGRRGGPLPLGFVLGHAAAPPRLSILRTCRPDSSTATVRPAPPTSPPGAWWRGRASRHVGWASCRSTVSRRIAGRCADAPTASRSSRTRRTPAACRAARW